MKLWQLLNFLGNPCKADIGFCKCKNDADVLTKLGYWPATSSRPNLAFSFSFLDWMEALLLEAQVPSQHYHCVHICKLTS